MRAGRGPLIMIGKCGACAYFVPGNADDPYTGSCHRRAPGATANVHAMILRLLADLHFKAFDGKDTNLSDGMKFEGDQPDWQNWPCVDDTDGCGDFSPR